MKRKLQEPPKFVFYEFLSSFNDSNITFDGHRFSEQLSIDTC